MGERALTLGEFFVGAGGLNLGFLLSNTRNIKFLPLFVVDHDKAALATYRRNIEWLYQNGGELFHKLPAILLKDIEKVGAEEIILQTSLDIGELDILLGGPPCQGYSTANRNSKKASKDARNRLVKVFFDKVAALRPRMFLLENVQGVGWTKPTDEMRVEEVSAPAHASTSSSNIDNVKDYMRKRAEELGYLIWSDTLNAVDFGVPQFRSRFFLFGVRADLVPATADVDLAPYLADYRVSNPVTVLDAIGDLPILDNGDSLSEASYLSSDTEYIQWLRMLVEPGTLDDHETTKHADYVIERFRMIPQGGNWKSIRTTIQNYADISRTHSNIYRRLDGSKPAITISHFRKSMVIHPLQDRGISYREAYRLQSFPDWFRFMGTRNERAQQLGNAVPPRLALALASAIGRWTLLNLPCPTEEATRSLKI